MEELLSTLNPGTSVTIETDKLPEFWEHCKTKYDLYAFRYQYFDTKVEITQTKETVFRIKRHDNQNQTT